MQFPRQKLFVAVGTLIAFIALGFLLYTVFEYVWYGAEFSMAKYWGLANLIILYITVFELMGHSVVEGAGGLLFLLLLPIAIMVVLWVPSMIYLNNHFDEYAAAMEKTNGLFALFLYILGFFLPLWPAFIFGLISNAIRG